MTARVPARPVRPCPFSHSFCQNCQLSNSLTLPKVPEKSAKSIPRKHNLMNIGIIGATGNIGQRILAEALSQPGNAAKDFDDVAEQSIRNRETYVTAAMAFLQALEQYPSLRLIVVGGAGSLEIKPGMTRAASPGELGGRLKQLGLPEAYEVAVRGHRDALNVYRNSNRLWHYLSHAEQILSGRKNGTLPARRR